MFEAGIHLSPEAWCRLEGTVQRLDVRQPWEHQVSSLPGAVLIPLNELADRLGELDPDRPVAVYCHHGSRSLFALRILQSGGFRDIAHLAGGIDAYSRMEPSVPRY